MIISNFERHSIEEYNKNQISLSVLCDLIFNEIVNNHTIIIKGYHTVNENIGCLLILIALFLGRIIFNNPPSSQLLRSLSNSSYTPRL